MQPNTTHTVYVSCLNAVIQAATAAGVDRNLLLRDTGISASLLSIAGERLPVSQFLALYESALKQTNDPDLGLRVGRIIYFLGLNLQLYMTTICDNFRQYLNVIPSTINLRGDLGQVLIRADGDFIRLEWHPLNSSAATARLIADEMLASSALIVGSICVHRVPVLAAHFSYERPSDIRTLQQTFGNELRFGCAVSALVLPRASLRYPLIRLDYELGQDFMATPQSLFDAGSESDDPFLRELRAAMRRTLPTGELTIDTLADAVGVSRRTLQRRLTERNASFKQLLQHLREELSIHYLDDSRLGITEIAFLLGYSDQASFSNAFRVWRDASPSEYRNRNYSKN